MPYDLNPGPVNVVVAANGLESEPAPVSVAKTAPGIFLTDGRHAAALNQDFKPNSADVRAPPRSVIVAYLTGAGLVDKPVAPGEAAPGDPLSRVLAEVGVTLGDKQAKVLFAGLTPGFVALTQINVEVPPDAGAGEQPMTVTVGGVRSNQAWVWIQ